MGSCLVIDGTFRKTLASIMQAFSGLLIFFAVLADTTPIITFPINSQVPPVARVSKPFTYTFSSSTFASNSSMTYALSGGPTWLSLDGYTRTLSGTAPQDEANTAPIIVITASDGSGSVTMNTTLVVSSSPAPTVVIPLDTQLESLGTSSSPDSILYYVSTPFKFSFNPMTFGNAKLNYYAVTLDNTPLPSWIYFDGSSLTFSGQTPDSGSLVQPPQTFGMRLIASDVLGFAGVAIPFYIVVGIHKLDFTNEIQTINVTTGTTIDFKGLDGTLHLDDQPANMSDITNITATTPDWLSFDNSTFALTGTPSPNATSFNITITASDIYQDVASAIVEVNIATSIFSKPLGSVNATVGEEFSLDLRSFFRHPEDITVSTLINPVSPWLSFDSETLILAGNVPSNILPSGIQVIFNATLKSTQVSESEILSVQVVEDPQTSTSSVITSPTSPPATTAAAAETSNKSSKKGIGKGQIAAAVLLPILTIFSLLILLCCYKRRKYLAEQRLHTPEKADISHPLPVLETGVAIGTLEKFQLRHQPEISNAFTELTFVTSQRHAAKSIRRTQTESAISYNGSTRDSRSTTARARSFSANAMSDYDGSWRSTQDSAYPRLPTTTTSRVTRNFSRKTNEFEQSMPPLRRENSSGFPIRQSELAFAPLRRLSRSSIQQTPNIVYDSENMKLHRANQRHTANYLEAIPNIAKRFSGIGHGSRIEDSGFRFDRDGHQSAGIGHSTAPITFESESVSRLPTDTSSWQTIEPEDHAETRRLSTMSSQTESTDVLEPESNRTTQYLTVRQVPKSPVTIRSLLSSSSGSRSDTRRGVGSPFFAGSSRSAAAQEPRKKRKSLYEREYSRPIPRVLVDENRTQDSLERSILQGLRDVEPATPSQTISQKQDALGISYANPREGTRHLQNFVSEISHRMIRGSRNNLTFSDSDSRFRSAEPSPASRAERMRSDEEEAYEHEHYGYSPTQLIPRKEREGEESTVMDVQIAKLPVSNSTTPQHIQLTKVQGRIMPGPGRPVSIDSTVRKQSQTTRYSKMLDRGEANDNDDSGAGSVAFL